MDFADFRARVEFVGVDPIRTRPSKSRISRTLKTAQPRSNLAVDTDDQLRVAGHLYVRRQHGRARTQMADAKLRILAAERILTSALPATGLAALDLEFCFLQIRRVIESITFGALVREQARYAALRGIEAHENSRDHGDPGRDWQAPEVLKRLVALSPHALPIPHKDPVEVGPGQLHLDRQRLEVNHSRLIELYKRAGGYLHAKNPLSGEFLEVVASERKKYEEAPEEVRKALTFLRNLLWRHAVVNLEPHREEDPRTPGNPDQAWLVDFGSEQSANVGLTLAEGA